MTTVTNPYFLKPPPQEISFPGARAVFGPEVIYNADGMLTIWAAGRFGVSDSPLSPDYRYKVYQSADDGLTYKLIGEMGASPRRVVIGPDQPAPAGFAVFQTLDVAGATPLRAWLSRPGVLPAETNLPFSGQGIWGADATYVYAISGETVLWRTADGVNWENRGAVAIPSMLNLTSTLYRAGAFWWMRRNNTLYRTTDPNLLTGWTAVTLPQYYNATPKVVFTGSLYLTLGVTQPNQSTPGPLLRSSDGITFVPMPGQTVVPFPKIVHLDVLGTGRMYLICDDGFIRTGTGAETWADLQLVAEPAAHFAVGPRTALSHGRFTFPMEESGVGEDESLPRVTLFTTTDGTSRVSPEFIPADDPVSVPTRVELYPLLVAGTTHVAVRISTYPEQKVYSILESTDNGVTFTEYTGAGAPVYPSFGIGKDDGTYINFEFFRTSDLNEQFVRDYYIIRGTVGSLPVRTPAKFSRPNLPACFGTDGLKFYTITEGNRVYTSEDGLDWVYRGIADLPYILQSNFSQFGWSSNYGVVAPLYRINGRWFLPLGNGCFTDDPGALTGWTESVFPARTLALRPYQLFNGALYTHGRYSANQDAGPFADVMLRSRDLGATWETVHTFPGTDAPISYALSMSSGLTLFYPELTRKGVDGAAWTDTPHAYFPVGTGMTRRGDRLVIPKVLNNPDVTQPTQALYYTDDLLNIQPVAIAPVKVDPIPAPGGGFPVPTPLLPYSLSVQNVEAPVDITAFSASRTITAYSSQAVRVVARSSASLQPVASFNPSGLSQVFCIAALGDFAFISYRATSGAGRIAKFNNTINGEAPEIFYVPFSSTFTAMVGYGEYLWASSPSLDLTKLRAQFLDTSATIPGLRLRSLVMCAGYIWGCNGINNSVARINPETLVVDTFAAPGVVQKLGVSGDRLYALLDGGVVMAYNSGFGPVAQINNAHSLECSATRVLVGRDNAGASPTVYGLYDGATSAQLQAFSTRRESFYANLYATLDAASRVLVSHQAAAGAPGNPSPFLLELWGTSSGETLAARLAFDSPNNATTFTEQTGKVVTNSGDVSASTSVKLSGTASAKFAEGGSGYVSVPAPATSANLYVSIAFYPQIDGQPHAIFSLPGAGITMYLDGAGQVCASIDDGGYTPVLETGAIVGEGQWHVAILERVGGVVFISVDGVRVGNSFPFLRGVAASTFNVGAGVDGGSRFLGFIDEAVLRVSNNPT